LLYNIEKQEVELTLKEVKKEKKILEKKKKKLKKKKKKKKKDHVQELWLTKIYFI